MVDEPKFLDPKKETMPTVGDKAYWGNPCFRHENIVAWVTKVKKDNEGLHCFGCFIESREKTYLERFAVDSPLVKRLVDGLRERIQFARENVIMNMDAYVDSIEALLDREVKNG